MTAANLLSALATVRAEYPTLVSAIGWLVAWCLVIALQVAWFHRIVSHADRDSNREQSERGPVTERPSKIFASSNHGGLSA